MQEHGNGMIMAGSGKTLDPKTKKRKRHESGGLVYRIVEIFELFFPTESKHVKR